MLDVSDGLEIDAGHLADRSGCRVTIELERVPLAEGAEPDDLSHGEDYELLAALAPTDADALGFPVVGTCAEGSGVELSLAGRPVRLRGWEHFTDPA